MTDVMLDIETFGNGRYAAICQIGACYFNRETGEIGETFKMNVDARFYGELQAETVYWWMEQSSEAIKSIIEKPRYSLNLVLEQLNYFLRDAKQIWSHATFDFVILQSAYRNLKMKSSFNYKTARDIRTLIDLSQISLKKVQRDGTHHDALDDCKHQVKYCVLAMNKIKKKIDYNKSKENL